MDLISIGKGASVLVTAVAAMVGLNVNMPELTEETNQQATETWQQTQTKVSDMQNKNEDLVVDVNKVSNSYPIYIPPKKKKKKD